MVLDLDEAESPSEQSDNEEVDDLDLDEAESSSEQSDNEEVDATPLSRREQQAAETLAKYEKWHDEVIAIKADRKLKHPLKASDIVSKVASKFGELRQTVKRRLNRDYSGWSEYEQVGKK